MRKRRLVTFNNQRKEKARDLDEEISETAPPHMNKNKKIVKKNSEYENFIENTAKKAVDDLEAVFKKRWQEHDDTLNEGGNGSWEDNGEDDIYNC